MFRRNKKSSSGIPKPPSKDEILSDLETFHVAQPIRERTRDSADTEAKQEQRTSSTLPTTSPTTSNRSTTTSAPRIDDAVWWSYFENFLADIDELKNYRQYLEFKKTDLAEFDSFITEESSEIDKQLREHIETAKSIIASDT